MKIAKKHFGGSMSAIGGIATLGEHYTATRSRIISNVEQGTLHAKKRIAGIPCQDVDTTEKMLGFFKKEDFQILELKEKLLKDGLPFRAIVRTDFYEEIKTKKHVYTFNHVSENGKVAVSESNVQRFIEANYTMFEKKATAFIVTMIVIVSIAIVAFGEWQLWIYPTANREANMFAFNIVVMWWVLGLICYGTGCVIEFLVKRFIFNASRFCKKIEKKLKKECLTTFWPNYRDYSIGPKVKIDFIEAPKTVAENILQWKLAGYSVDISAQKEAFSLDTSLLKTFLQDTVDDFVENLARKRALELQAKIEARRLFWQKYDPIISVEIDKFTVLIDAYGGKSFVSEAEVVDSVMNFYNEKLKEFQTILN